MGSNIQEINEGGPSLDLLLGNLHELGTTYDEKALRNFLFEYACLTAEHEKISPLKATGYLHWISYKKLETLITLVEDVRERIKSGEKIQLTFPTREVIEQLVLYEHGCLDGASLDEVLEEDDDYTGGYDDGFPKDDYESFE